MELRVHSSVLTSVLSIIPKAFFFFSNVENHLYFLRPLLKCDLVSSFSEKCRGVQLISYVFFSSAYYGYYMGILYAHAVLILLIPVVVIRLLLTVAVPSGLITLILLECFLTL